jgi:hypothetical protein
VDSLAPTRGSLGGPESNSTRTLLTELLLLLNQVAVLPELYFLILCQTKSHICFVTSKVLKELLLLPLNQVTVLSNIISSMLC